MEHMNETQMLFILVSSQEQLSGLGMVLLAIASEWLIEHASPTLKRLQQQRVVWYKSRLFC
jgi:hypothetical protein